jgi:hypothetical protein
LYKLIANLRARAIAPFLICRQSLATISVYTKTIEQRACWDFMATTNLEINGALIQEARRLTQLETKRQIVARRVSG